MSLYTKIEWAHHTANLWHGCTQVHEGCQNCYAKNQSHHYRWDIWGNNKPRRLIKYGWQYLGMFQKEAASRNNIHRVFVGSMKDIFEHPMPLIADKNGSLLNVTTGDLRQQLFQKISEGIYPNLDFLLLTKRPSNINKYIPEAWKLNPPENVMFGTSPVNQATANILIRQIAKVNGRRFLSVEPQLDRLTLMPWLRTGVLDWVIVGGESGPKKRIYNTDWARQLRDECKATNVPFFFKQVDQVKDIPDDLMIREFYSQNHKSNISRLVR